MSSVLKHWREAATLLLVARTKKTHIQASGGTNYKVLMLKRSRKSKFMPSLHVFPGGVAHDSDFSADWLDIFHLTGHDLVNGLFKHLQRGGSGAYMFSRQRPEKFSKIPSELAFRICAIRETFEESGILLVRGISTVKNEKSAVEDHPLYGKTSILSETILMPWRKRVDADPTEFLTMCRELKVIPDVWSLYEWSNWLTPIIPQKSSGASESKTSGRRYDTSFFLSVVDYIPVAAHDDKETVALEWSSAEELLEKHFDKNSDMRLAPPQIVELSRLLNFSDADVLKDFAFRRSSRRALRYLPVPCQCDNGGVLYLYPGDDLYPAAPDCEGSRPVMKVSGTVQELAVKYPNHNRSEIFMDEAGKIIRSFKCNVKMADNQVLPLLKYSVSSKL